MGVLDLDTQVRFQPKDAALKPRVPVWQQPAPAAPPAFAWGTDFGPLDISTDYQGEDQLQPWTPVEPQYQDTPVMPSQDPYWDDGAQAWRDPQSGLLWDEPSQAWTTTPTRPRVPSSFLDFQPMDNPDRAASAYDWDTYFKRQRQSIADTAFLQSQQEAPPSEADQAYIDQLRADPYVDPNDYGKMLRLKRLSDVQAQQGGILDEWGGQLGDWALQGLGAARRYVGEPALGVLTGAGGMERVPILRLGSVLLVSVQIDLQDDTAVALQEDLADRVVETGASGVVIDISALEIVDSYIGRMLVTIASIVRVLGADTVVTGMRPAVAITLVELGLSLDGVRTALDTERGMRMLAARADVWQDRDDRGLDADVTP